MLLGLPACDGETKEEPTQAPTPSVSARPVDTTLPGELAEGDEKAFGFPIPRKMRVRGRFDDAIYARGRVPFEAVSNYVSERVSNAAVNRGPSMTIYDRATLDADDSRTIRIEIKERFGDIEIVVREQTRRPDRNPGMSEAQRWRRAGLNPDGSVIEDRAE